MMNIFKKNSKESIKKQCFEENAILTQPLDINQLVNEQYFEEKTFSAQDALEIASSKWAALPNEKIIEDIKRYAERGDRSVYFFERIITEEQILSLEEMGFQVSVKEQLDKTPYFRVSW